MTKGSTLAPCGTTAAAKRHYKRGEKPCEPCRLAQVEYTRRRQGYYEPRPPCAECGETLPPGRRVVCSEECRIDRLIASDAYKRAQERQLTTIVCEVCGADHRARPGVRYCSHRCRGIGVATALGTRANTLPVLHTGPRTVTLLPESHPARLPTTRPRKWVSKTCSVCHDYFVAPYTGTHPATCGPTCHREKRRVERRNRKAYERALTRGARPGAFTLQQWGQRLIQYGRRCAYCQDPDAPTEIEHVIPLSRDGSNRIANVVPACRACNQEKGALTPSEWLDSGLPRTAAGTAHPTRTPEWPTGEEMTATELRAS